MTDTTTTPGGGTADGIAGGLPEHLRSRHVRVGELPWQPADFPGVEYKTLLIEIGRASCRERV
jgi:hypothetical protein